MENINKFFRNNFQKIVTVVIVIIFVSIVGFLLQDKNVSNLFKIENVKYVKIAGKILKTDLALTKDEQEKGLSFRKDLKEDESMLFVFNNADKHSFWMKDMNFTIDIIWIDDNYNVVYIKENATPQSYLSTSKTGPEIFFPTKDAMYVLEVLGSFSEKNNLKIGDKVEFLSS